MLKKHNKDQKMTKEEKKRIRERLKKRRRRAKKNGTSYIACSEKLRTGPKIKPKADGGGTNRHTYLSPHGSKLRNLIKRT